MGSAARHGKASKTSETGGLLVVGQHDSVCLQHLIDSALLRHAGLPKELIVQILSWVPLSRSKLALLSLGRDWLAAMADPEVHVLDPPVPLRMGPTAPKLQADILAAIPFLHVTGHMG